MVINKELESMLICSAIPPTRKEFSATASCSYDDEDTLINDRSVLTMYFHPPHPERVYRFCSSKERYTMWKEQGLEHKADIPYAYLTRWE